MRGVLLNPTTGRPDLPAPFDKPGVLASFTDEQSDLERELFRAPQHILDNLHKGRQARLRAEELRIPNLAMTGSLQSWEEVLYSPGRDADGTPVTAAAETTMFPIFTLPANYLYPGRSLKWTVFGRQSTAITTPGTITFKLSYSAAGTGAVVMATSGAFAPDPTAAATNLTFMLEWWTIVRTAGTAGTGMSVGRVEWTDYDDASAATIVGNLNMRMAPTSAPATAAIDTTVARSLNPTYTSSVSTASMTAHFGYLEAIT